jgi:hypothetical protein
MGWSGMCQMRYVERRWRRATADRTGERQYGVGEEDLCQV